MHIKSEMEQYASCNSKVMAWKNNRTKNDLCNKIIEALKTSVNATDSSISIAIE